MKIVEIKSLDDDGLEVYSALTEAQLRSRVEPEKGIIIVESPKVISVALSAGYQPLSILCERKHIDGDAADLIKRCGDVVVYTGEREILSTLTGYTLTRGVLCAMRRPKLLSVEDVCRNARRVAVLDGIVDNTNVGAIFRSAAALNVDAVIVTSTSCDPLNRRSIRVSMGAVFLVPWTFLHGKVSVLRTLGFRTVAMALSDNAVAIDDPELNDEDKLAIVLGSEGYGLDEVTINEADYVARIPMSNNVDSLNVAAASSIAFWQLRKKM